MRAVTLATMALAVALATSTAASARDLAVPAGKGWQHAASGLVLLPTLAGLTRTGLSDNGTAERDVIAQFADADEAVQATIFLFSPAEASVPLWFDRAETAMLGRTAFKGATPLTPAAIAFAPPGSTIQSALRRGYVVPVGPFPTTAIAAIPSGDWLVVIRISGKTTDAAALDAVLSRLIADIRWPAATPAVAAVSIAACPATTTFHMAKLRKADLQASLLGSLIAGAAMLNRKPSVDAAAAAPWCRNGEGQPLWAVYRKPDVTAGYMLALGDSGRVVDVFPGLSLDAAKPDAGFAITLRDIDGSAATYPMFDRLPAPEQVLTMVMKTAPTTRTRQTDGKLNVTVDSSIAQ
ncbi:hypothetical protein ASG67_12395 [Sphingomonas sp. Leaf339]|uniref:hypothetical protein n=1 Tax=Sphingomonas sp. Leaf339 TaxID=1736343 RepID=UPI0006F201D0|nr:hypothetical protein [Sphingomonas sp. Leaf339]KQU48135.1 hypothetical protein ASG67_12395 [Sphingomonas sp. Leaf339]